VSKYNGKTRVVNVENANDVEAEPVNAVCKQIAELVETLKLDRTYNTDKYQTKSKFYGRQNVRNNNRPENRNRSPSQSQNRNKFNANYKSNANNDNRQNPANDCRKSYCYLCE